MPHRLIFLAFFFAYVAALVTPASAHSLDQALDTLHVKKPVILPGSFVYPLKEFVRALQLAFTRDKVTKSLLASRVADEKLAEFEVLADSAAATKTRIETAFENYLAGERALGKTLESIPAASDTHALMETLAERMFAHQEFYDEVVAELGEDAHDRAVASLAANAKIARAIDGSAFRDALRHYVETSTGNFAEPQQTTDLLYELDALSKKSDGAFDDLASAIRTAEETAAASRNAECGPLPATPLPIECVSWKCEEGAWKASCLPPLPPAPQVCTEEYRPVCGSDGKTYSNRCFAQITGITVVSEGECRGGGKSSLPQELK